MAWMIDGNKLKEKAVPLLFPSNMEPCGYIPVPVQAVIVDEIANMLYRDGIEIVRCKDCKYRGDHMVCPMCFEEQMEWDDDGYTEIDWIVHDRAQDESFCDRGETENDES